ncbi:integrase family protein [Yersinia pseudotuberculosis]|uniref:Integrase family protein n=2 Tax=Yersinia pseudotuberculosis TaxID=633 RepID=A0A380QDS3_YERPU|nr:integrase family protein [Yersinia pseudotuberculosis]
MAGELNKLTDKKLKNLLGTTRAKYEFFADGAGLSIRVSTTGGISWTYTYRITGGGAKLHRVTLGRYVHFCNDSDGLKEEYIDKFYISDAVSYVSSIFNDDDQVSVEFFNKNPPLEKILPCTFSGFWAIPHQAFGCGQLYEFKPSLFDLWLSANKKMFILFDIDEYISISIDYLYLLKSDFKIISECKSNEELPNYFNEGKKEVQLDGVTKKTSENHPTTERHSKNKFEVVSAAFRFKEENEELFNEKCRHKNGEFNFSAWAREVKSRESRLFEKCRAPVIESKIAEYISLALRHPHPNK